MNIFDALPVAKGAYVVWLEANAHSRVTIGRLGTMQLQPGYYAYIGSAMGPGGIRARLRHHLRIAVRPRWHVDYLRAACDVCELWYGVTEDKGEHRWVAAIADLPGAMLAMPGFGASDHPGATHLFRFDAVPSVEAFVAQLGRSSGAGNDSPEITRVLVPAEM